jgi:peptide/nickel transport system substrate-binding protein
MKKLLFVILSVVIIASMMLAGCGNDGSTTKTADITKGAVSGGTLRIIYNAAPAVLGGSVEQGPFDLFVLLGGVEKIMDYNDEQVIAPWLAESVKQDDSAKTITVKLRAGIKCHDGSDFDADAMMWNFQNQIDRKRIGYLDSFVKMEKIDKVTMKIYYQGDYNNQLLASWLWSPPMYSKGAWDKAVSETGEASEWARNNFSGTGPFKLLEYQRDVKLILERFDDYWGPKPYLDRIEFIFIPETVTASSMMEAGEADMWLSGPVNDQLFLVEKGLVRQMGLGTIPCIYPNNVIDKYKDVRILQAMEYALDKAAMANTLGQGQYTALKMLSPEGRMGYDADYEGHPYNVAKAKELLSLAGYPDGIHVKITALVGQEDTCMALKQFWDAAGIITEIDIADAGRFYGGLYGGGWEDLLLTGYGEGDMLGNFQNNLGDQPLTKMSAASWVLPPELDALSKQSRTYAKTADQEEAMKKITVWMAENCFVIPLWLAPGSFVCQDWVHTDYLKQGGFTFYFGRYWMETQK